jgi:uncharacterized protein (TIGR02646 family)
MRPVVRGKWPTDEQDREIQFNKYTEARGELIARMGEYCSYCETKINSDLAVEHIRPKKPKGAMENISSRELDWNNFLLACKNCNSTKGNKEVVLDDYFWPDRDNTFRALKYSEGGIVSPSDDLDVGLKEKAQATITLTGLDKRPSNDPKASDRRWEHRMETWNIAVDCEADLKESDRRWKHRKEAWDLAVNCEADLKKDDIKKIRDRIIVTAKAMGFWSIWTTVFKDHPEMLKGFIKAFPGTSEECFDESEGYKAVNRVGGNI